MENEFKLFYFIFKITFNQIALKIKQNSCFKLGKSKRALQSQIIRWQLSEIIMNTHKHLSNVIVSRHFHNIFGIGGDYYQDMKLLLKRQNTLMPFRYIYK